MAFNNSRRAHVIGLYCAVATLCGALVAQQGMSLFATADANGDGYVTREELRAAVLKWLPAGAASADEKQLEASLNRAFPAQALTQMLAGSGPQNQTPKAEDVQRMEASLPSKAPATPTHARKVLVLSKAAGYVHSCIPLAAKTVEELGAKTGAWTTTVTYDAAAINADSLKQYDLIFLNNTTGKFLDDADASVTAARKKALLDFVRSGKGLAGIHAAGDSYHEAGPSTPGLGGMMAGLVMTAADTNKDGRVSAEELGNFSDTLFDRLDRNKSGKVSDADLRGKIFFTMMGMGHAGGAHAMPRAAQTGPDHEVALWPEFDKMIGGYFKWHWTDPTHIVYRIDDSSSPLTAMFKGGEFALDDETYTFSIHSWSRKNLHVLTSIDYSKMSEADKNKEDYPRADHDYGLSWIRRDGQGRVFYMAHGHDEKVYANPIMLEHLLAGIQYALGDLKANDAPSE